ncbi:MAG: site-specific DNA-methyltransferase [Acidobacteria bacterium]|nr:site-specific DNA-methyltransferase [Acidobacteriota bacterium]
MPEVASQRLQVVYWPIEKLIPFARNPRTHSEEQISQIAASIQAFGWTNPILVDPDSVIIAGHVRALAARKLRMTEVPVIVLSGLSEAQRRALVIADNQLALNAGWDEEMLRLELVDLHADDFDLELLGFSDDELAEFLADPGELTDGLTDEDAAPELPESPVSALGDCWCLGRHKLVVGDATIAADVDHLMNGEKADLVFTDPPYCVGYTGYTEEQLTIQGDRMTDDQFREFLGKTFASYRRIVKPEASLYVFHPSSWQREFQNALEAAGFNVRCQIIWAKNTFAWGFGRYKFQHEPIFYAHVASESDAWYGDKSQSTLWQENKPAANRLHPTMKPVELIERALVNSSRKNSVVADLFRGAGSTMIACERLGRAARLMDVDLRYCDVTIQRFQEFSGKTAVLDGVNQSFEEIARERKNVAA